MKGLRLFLLLTALFLLCAQCVSAAGIWIPDENEIGDLQTDKPYRPETDESGEVDPDSIPHEVDPIADIVKPTALCAIGALVIYLLLRLIRFLVERYHEKHPA